MKAYEEIMNVLAWYFGDGEFTPSEESIREIIGQESDPIATIATALDDYRDSEVKP
ncbi:hypothetical protein [Serratia fonticola]|uniref:hypothetical protein n=1 Tax=Serratia fonticola TaxID=47917 RepID=UPI000AB828A4|nr:hypothetical protein [Serratia fonticola]